MKGKSEVHTRLTHRIAQPRKRHIAGFVMLVRYPTTAAIRKALRDSKTTTEERNVLYSWLTYRKHRGQSSEPGWRKIKRNR